MATTTITTTNGDPASAPTSEQPPPPAPSSAFLLRSSTDAATFSAAVWGRVFNHRRDHSRVPFAVCKARTTADVVAAVQLARAHGVRVSVRSGGHSWAGWSVRHDAVLVDLGDLDLDEGASEADFAWAVDGGRGGGRGRIVYDPASKIVSCPPSTTGRMLNGYLATVEGGKGRMFAGGHCPDVGLGGFLLQGGMGWNCKNWGWACEAIVAIDVVTADARELHCSAVENEELFWACRGAGPGFPAIVTRFHLLTRPKLEMYQSVYIYPIARFREVLAWEIALAPHADTSIEMVGVSSYLPGFDELTILASFTCFQPSRAEAEAALRPIDADPARPSGARVAVFAQPTDLTFEYGNQAKANPEGHRYCAENAYVADDVDDVPAVLEDAFSGVPTRKSFALWFSMNPCSRRALGDVGAVVGAGPGPANPGMALSMQSDHYFALYTVWEDGKDDDRCTAWVHDTMKRVERHAVGSYLGDADFQHRRTKFWTDDCAAKLNAIRRKWDPEGRIAAYLDEGDRSGVDGLKNEFEWLKAAE